MSEKINKTTLFVRAAIVTVFVTTAIVWLGYLFDWEILIRGGFPGFPVQRFTTGVEFILTALCLGSIHNRSSDWRFNTAFFAQALMLISVSIFFINSQGNSIGLESLVIGVGKVDPSQAAQIGFCLLAMSFLLSAKRIHHNFTQNVLTLFVVIICLTALIGYWTGDRRLFFELPQVSYGLAVPTAFGLLIVATANNLLHRRRRGRGA